MSRDEWTAGYICAVATVIRLEGHADQTAKELLDCIKVPPRSQITQVDRDIFDEHEVFEMISAQEDGNR